MGQASALVGCFTEAGILAFSVHERNWPLVAFISVAVVITLLVFNDTLRTRAGSGDPST